MLASEKPPPRGHFCQIVNYLSSMKKKDGWKHWMKMDTASGTVKDFYLGKGPPGEEAASTWTLIFHK